MVVPSTSGQFSSPVERSPFLKPTVKEFNEEWRIMGLLGRGGFSEVYKVRFKGQLYALKLLKEGDEDEDDKLWLGAKDRLLKEGEALHMIRHNHIISSHGIVEVEEGCKALKNTSTRYGLLLELCTGGPLTNKILDCIFKKGGKKYSMLEAVRWAIEVSEAVSYLHSMEPCMIHRDIKSENILLTKDSNGVWTTKLADLGLHQVLDGRKGMGLPSLRTGTYSRPHSLMGDDASVRSIPCSVQDHSVKKGDVGNFGHRRVVLPGCNLLIASNLNAPALIRNPQLPPSTMLASLKPSGPLPHIEGQCSQTALPGSSSESTLFGSSNPSAGMPQADGQLAPAALGGSSNHSGLGAHRHGQLAPRALAGSSNHSGLGAHRHGQLAPPALAGTSTHSRQGATKKPSSSLSDSSMIRGTLQSIKSGVRLDETSGEDSDSFVNMDLVRLAIGSSTGPVTGEFSSGRGAGFDLERSGSDSSEEAEAGAEAAEAKAAEAAKAEAAGKAGDAAEAEASAAKAEAKAKAAEAGEAAEAGAAEAEAEAELKAKAQAQALGPPSEEVADVEIDKEGDGSREDGEAAEISKDKVRAAEISKHDEEAAETSKDAVRAAETSKGEPRASEMHKDAVRVSEMRKGAVRAAEMRKDAVRVAEMSQDGGGAAQTSQHAYGTEMSQDAVRAGEMSADEVKAGAMSEDEVRAGAMSEDEVKAGGMSEDEVKAGAMSGHVVKAGAMSEDEVRAAEMSQDGGEAAKTSQHHANSITLCRDGGEAAQTSQRAYSAGSEDMDEIPLEFYDLTYNLTGNTGSYFYMPPEVHLSRPYNQKADVFSFGIVMYELFSREMLVVTHCKNATDPEAAAKAYLDRVCGTGWRPARASCIPDCVWDVIQACWQHDPGSRPDMATVSGLLRLCEATLEAQQHCPGEKEFSFSPVASLTGARPSLKAPLVSMTPSACELKLKPGSPKRQDQAHPRCCVLS